MKILLSAFHNPNFTNTVVYRELAIKRLGHELITFNDRGFILPGRVRAAIPRLAQWDLKRLNTDLVKTVQLTKPDVVFCVGGQRIFPDTVKAMGSKHRAVVLWTTDAPDENFKNIEEAAPFYDHLFCAGTEAADIFKAQGLSNVTWVPFACDLHFHKKVFLTPHEQALGRDVVFIGSYYPNRAKLLEAIADCNLGVWGPYWSQLDPQSPLKPKTTEIKMNYDQWVKIYNASKIVVVVHYQDPHVPCHQVSPKLFEAMACGSFVLTDRQKDVQALFKDKEHLVYFDDAADLRRKVDYYLAHPDERRRIAEQGYREACANHTYEHRFQYMLDAVKHKG